MLLFQDPAATGLVLHHKGDLPFNIAQMCWFAAGHYHLEPATRRLFHEKPYPFHATASAETGDWGPDFPARPATIRTYHEKDYAIGTATTPWTTGWQSAPYAVLYKRRATVKTHRDTGCIFTKFLINDAPLDAPSPTPVPASAPAADEHLKVHLPKVGASLATPAPGGKNWRISSHERSSRASQAKPLRAGREERERREAPRNASEEESDICSHATTFTLQSGPTVLTLTQPHMILGGKRDHSGPSAAAATTTDGSTTATAATAAADAAIPLTSLRESMIFPKHSAAPCDELLVAGQPRDTFSGDVPRGCWIACRFGRLLIAVRPLAHGAALDNITIRLRTEKNYQFITTIYHEGAPRIFTRNELRHIFGGHLIEHASVDEYPSLADFACHLKSDTTVLDYWWTTRLVTYRREAIPRRSFLQMDISLSAGAFQPRYAQINGIPAPAPLLDITGIDATTIPILSDPWTPPPPPALPWATLPLTPFCRHHLDAWGDSASIGDH
jgi:hypothetical protein